MAARGLRLDRFYAAAPVCSPTRGSVLTGRHPNRFGCFSWGHHLRPEETTIAEALQAAGYATGHFGKWHLGPVRADSPVCPGNSGFDEWFSSPNFYENSPLLSAAGRVVQTDGESSAVTVEPALRFIRAAAERRQPFLAVVWFGNPHSPHEALPELRALYSGHPERLQNYYGEITGIDRAVGTLRDELARLGVAAQTLVWYTSDNGAQGPGSTGGLSGRKGSLWEGGIRVPAILEWPARIKSPRTSDIPCNTVDIYPTLLELAGATVSNQPELDGVSLVPLLDGKATQRTKPMAFWVYPERGRPMRSAELLREMARDQKEAEQAAASPPQAEQPADGARLLVPPGAEDLPGHAAWIDGDWKLHRIPQRGGGFEYRLFDLNSDREEQHDLSGRQPERVEQMMTSLEAWQRSVLRSLDGNDY
jgi:arylsulfatase A-like enzyme